ncbi:MAG: transketolase, partial [Candidatus Omnitrophota bacterium]
MQKKLKILKSKASEVRKLIVEMLAKAASGHPGGSLSSADIVTCLYFDVMRHNPKEPKWPDRDKFHLSKGHCCPALYAVLAICGYFPKENLWTLRKFN